MSMYPPPNAPGVYPAPQAAPTNGLGLAGFIVSLVGLISCGLLSPVGAIMSAVAMRREPKGFAIAGLVLGLLGSLWVLIAGLFLLVAGVGVIFALIYGAQLVEMTQDAQSIHSQVQQYVQTHGTVPQSLDQLNIDPNIMKDPWGQPYRFESGPGPRDFTLRSDGNDGQAGTSDDIIVEYRGGNIDVRWGSGGSIRWGSGSDPAMEGTPGGE